MAQITSAARRYAEAAFQLGVEAGTLEQWQQDLDVLTEVAGDAGALAVLENGKQPLEQRLALLERALGSMSPLTRNLALLLLTRNRLGILPQIAAVFGEMLDRHNGVARARVVTAVPLGEEEERAMRERLRVMTGARDVRLQSEVDPSIIGGVVVRVGDKLIDGSTRSRLVQMRRQLAGTGSSQRHDGRGGS